MNNTLKEDLEAVRKADPVDFNLMTRLREVKFVKRKDEELFPVAKIREKASLDLIAKYKERIRKDCGKTLCKVCSEERKILSQRSCGLKTSQRRCRKYNAIVFGEVEV